MALVRILIDGYSLLHAWPNMAPGLARHTAGARDALLARLTRYQDSTGVPLTIFFDGQGAPSGTPKAISSPKVEVLYSRRGQTADDLIERVVYRLLPYGEVLVITNDHAERDTVIGLGGHAQSCEGFISTIEATLGELESDLATINRRERDRFRRG
jgi:predicted RNA-binding protein with PIN domain